MQLPTVTWDVVSGDPSARTTADGMIRNVVSKARPGSIVIFHINGRGHKTAEALPVIVRELRERGFRFVQVSELMASATPAPPIAPFPGARGAAARGADPGCPVPPRRSRRDAFAAAPRPRRGRSERAGRSRSRGRPRVAAVAREQAAWIAGIEPWRGLGYRAAAARPLPRQAGARRRRLGRPGRRAAHAGWACVVVATDGFLLGGFIALLAVQPEASGQGIGQRAGRARRGPRLRRGGAGFSSSCDADNRAALRFYRRQGFARVGRLPDLVARGANRAPAPQAASPPTHRPKN